MADSPESSALAYVEALMRAAIGTLERFPADFRPATSEAPLAKDVDGKALGSSVPEMLRQPEAEAWLRGVLADLPAEMLEVFDDVSGVLAQAVTVEGDTDPMADLLGIMDPVSTNLLTLLGRLDEEPPTGTGADQPGDPLGQKELISRELHRRRLASQTPCARTLTTLLGEDALVWLNEDSRYGGGRLKPHEFARTGWHDLLSIRHQLAIEQELSISPPEFHYQAKIAVGLAWTLAAMASFIDPAVFLGEKVPYFSSVREGNVTLSHGDTRSLLVFEPRAMISVVRVLADGLINPLLSAADLMWIGASLARVREVRIGDEVATPSEERFAMFLSHRGCDAKPMLSAAVQALPPGHGVFLDCQTLPHGVVNRNFVFGSLARSSRVLIVETEHFEESEWCRKEAWFAEALAANGLAVVEHCALPVAQQQVAAVGPKTRRRRPDRKLEYPIAALVARDADYWARAPNLHSLREAGHATDLFAPLQALLDDEPQPGDTAWVTSLGKTVARTLDDAVAAAPEATPFAFWASALQLSLAAFGAASNGRSKVEIRSGVDRMLNVLTQVLRVELHRHESFQRASSHYLALMAGATAIELAGFDLDRRMEPALRLAMGRTAAMRDNLLLLDTREPGPHRDFQLQLLALFVGQGLGSVGIVQDAADEVHQGYVGDMPLGVLPCVTLYPGMDDSFA